MPPRLAILGLDPVQQPWLDAVAQLATTGEIELVAVADRSLAAARETASHFNFANPLPVFDDLRLLVKDKSPQLLVMDRPANVTLEFLLACAAAEIGILSLGPPVNSLAEAQALAAALPAQTHLLYIWPQFAESPAARFCAQADDFVRPIRFAHAAWMGVNHALAKSFVQNNPGTPLPDLPIRSLSVLAWDSLATLIRLMEIPTTVYAAIRGTVPSGSTFSDLTGAAAVALRFPDDAAASLTLTDRAPAILADEPAAAPAGAALKNQKSKIKNPIPWSRRDLALFGNGTLELHTHAYHFRDADARLIDSGSPPNPPDSGEASALATLREFLRHQALPPSPARGWLHQLAPVAATLEALVVSHRTGQPESPDRFLHLRR